MLVPHTQTFCSTGFNVAEAMNFGLVDWVPKGMLCFDLYRDYHKTAPFSMHQLVVNNIHKERAPGLFLRE